MQDTSYDAIVVGAGMAGFLVAARLAEQGVNPANGEPLRVALLDRGPYFGGTSRPGYGVPLRRRMFTNITSEFHENGRYRMQYYPDGPGGPNTWPAASASIVGGGSLHWRAQTRVPLEEDYRAWSEVHGLKDWTREDFREAAGEVVRMFNIHSRPEELLNRGDLLFRDSARELGYTVFDAQVAKKNCLLCWGCEGGNFCKYDARLGSYVAYLPILEKHSVEVIDEAEARQIVIENRRATGVLYRRQGRDVTIRAPKIIVSCGVYGTPLLLMRSGFGPRELLGDRTRIENANVGRNVDGRPGPMVLTGLFPEPITTGDYTDGGFYAIHDTDPGRLMGRVQFRWDSPVLGDPHLLAIHSAAPDFGREHKKFMRQVCDTGSPTPAQRELTRRGNMLVRVVRPPEVLGTISDRVKWTYDVRHPTLVPIFDEARAIGREIFRKMGAREVKETSPPFGTSFNSMTGSCRAGADPKTSVVNSHFECHDVENLFLCDASVTPMGATIGYGAPTATVAALGYRRIIERHFSR